MTPRSFGTALPQMLERTAVLALAGAVLLSAGAAASAQSRQRYPRASYYQLPFSGYLEPGTEKLLRPNCDDSYPMHESMPCGSGTGGPVGGLGS